MPIHTGSISAMAGVFAVLLVGAIDAPPVAADQHGRFARSWPNTDFATASVDLDEILSGGPGRDGIPAILKPMFIPADQALERYAGREPAISLSINGDARAYPLQILTWHEIANDTVGGLPLAITYCPLCNAAIAFDRRLDGRTLSFGVSGLLRHSDMVMYDRETESWWQQFTGEAIVGAQTGARLEKIPARLEALSEFVARHPGGKVLVPNNRRMRPYGENPYASYDGSARPFLFRGELPDHVAPMTYVVVVDEVAFGLEMLREKGEVVDGDLRLRATHDLASALDAAEIADGRALPGVVVERLTSDGAWQEAVYGVTFAFVFHAFHPDGEWRL